MRILYTVSFLLILNFTYAQTSYLPPVSGNNWETTDFTTLNWCPEKVDELRVKAENTFFTKLIVVE